MNNPIAAVGDTIKWVYGGITYMAKVEHINIDGDYCVYVTYADHGYTQDCISPSDVIAVIYAYHYT